MNESFHVIVDDNSNLRLVGELDLATEPILADAMTSIPAGERVTLDFSELSFIDASGLGRLAKCAAVLNGRGPLTILNPSAHVLRLFEIVGLDKELRITVR